MSAEQPTILFVPGAWHGPDGFDAVRASLSSRKIPTVALALPSIGAEPPSKGLTDDTVFVQSEIKKLVDEGKRIVVVTHSYGGMVGAGAVKGLEYAERQKQGKHGGVIMLVYMAAFVASRGDSLLKMLGGNYLPWMKVQVIYINSLGLKHVIG
jgi:pimeloyl-ACP methyl ester carboxylesterase